MSEQNVKQKRKPYWMIWIGLSAVAGVAIALFLAPSEPPPAPAAPEEPPPAPKKAGMSSAKSVSFLRSQVRSALSAVWVDQTRTMQTVDKFLPNVLSIGWLPPEESPYTFYFAPSGPFLRQAATDNPEPRKAVIVGLYEERYPNHKFYETVADTKCPVTEVVLLDGSRYGVGVVDRHTEGHWHYLFLAAGNLDDDEKLDCWTIASTERTTAAGETIPANTPYLEQSDL